MNLIDITALAIVLVIVGAAVAYIVREKRRGVKCIGCPVAGCSSCSGEGGSCGCGCAVDIRIDPDLLKK